MRGQAYHSAIPHLKKSVIWKYYTAHIKRDLVFKKQITMEWGNICDQCYQSNKLHCYIYLWHCAQQGSVVIAWSWSTHMINSLVFFYFLVLVINELIPLHGNMQCVILLDVIHMLMFLAIRTSSWGEKCNTYSIHECSTPRVCGHYPMKIT